MTQYNPYDLLIININGQETYGRPFEFDSEVKDQIKMTNAFGNIIKPIKVSTTCPSCGAGLILDVIFDYDPPFRPVSERCVHCNPNTKISYDPFVNPIETGRITKSDLDATIVEIDTPIEVPTTTVADRLRAQSGILPEQPNMPDMFETSQFKKAEIEEADDAAEEEDFEDDYDFD